MPQFEFSSQRSAKPPIRKAHAPAKIIQLPTAIRRRLSSGDKWAREAGGSSRTLKRRSDCTENGNNHWELNNQLGLQFEIRFL